MGVRASALPFPLDYLLILLTLNPAAVLCPIASLFLPILAISRPSTYALLWYPYIYFACNVFYFLRIHVNLLASTATRERGHPLSCGPSDLVGLVTLVLKRSSPSPSSGLSYRPQVHPHPSPPRPDDAAVIVCDHNLVTLETCVVYFYLYIYFYFCIYFYFYIYFYFCSSATYEYYAPDAADTANDAPDAVDDARYPAYDARYPAYDVANSDDVAAVDARTT
ncbi:hypothetical protein FB107DRAFT_252406 [Schizophyllum commune]